MLLYFQSLLSGRVTEVSFFLLQPDVEIQFQGICAHLLLSFIHVVSSCDKSIIKECATNNNLLPINQNASSARRNKQRKPAIIFYLGFFMSRIEHTLIISCTSTTVYSSPFDLFLCHCNIQYSTEKSRMNPRL